MTYGFVPHNWYAFARELAERGLAAADIEKVEIRPTPGAAPTTVDIVVTARSGQVHTWRQDEAVSAADPPR